MVMTGAKVGIKSVSSSYGDATSSDASPQYGTTPIGSPVAYGGPDAQADDVELPGQLPNNDHTSSGSKSRAVPPPLDTATNPAETLASDSGLRDAGAALGPAESSQLASVEQDASAEPAETPQCSRQESDGRKSRARELMTMKKEESMKRAREAAQRAKEIDWREIWRLHKIKICTAIWFFFFFCFFWFMWATWDNVHGERDSYAEEVPAICEDLIARFHEDVDKTNQRCEVDTRVLECKNEECTDWYPPETAFTVTERRDLDVCSYSHSLFGRYHCWFLRQDVPHTRRGTQDGTGLKPGSLTRERHVGVEDGEMALAFMTTILFGLFSCCCLVVCLDASYVKARWEMMSVGQRVLDKHPPPPPPVEDPDDIVVWA